MRISFGHRLALFTRFFLLSLFAVVLQSYSLNSHRPPPREQLFWNSNFPEEVALAAYGNTNKKEEEPASEKSLQADNRLRCLFKENDFSQATSSDDERLKTAVEEAAGKGIDNDDREEIAQAVQLIKTGQFYRDIRSAAEVSSGLFPELRMGMVSDLVEPKLVSCAITAPIKDITDRQTLFANTLGHIVTVFSR